MAGIDASKISAVNPFEKRGKTAEYLQTAVAEVDPAQAARWRVAAGGGLSVQTLSELQSGEQLSAAVQQDLYQHDDKFVFEIQAQQKQEEAAFLKQMETAVEASQRARMGDAGYEKAQKIEAQRKAEADKALLFERSYREERQRLAIQQQQQQIFRGTN